jgi:PKD repeat protein
VADIIHPTETMIAPDSRPTRRAPRLLLVLLVGAAAAAMVACESIALTAPTQSTISLFTNTNVVPVNGSAEITATVIEQAGTPVHNGTQVTFTTTIGVIEPAEARTRDGKATVRLVVGGQSGVARISAFSGAARSDTIEVQVGGAAASRLVLTASPTAIPAGGGTVQLTAIVTDENGNRLPGVPVTFTADAGTLSQPTVPTDASGEARTTLTTARETTVSATAGRATATDVLIRVAQLPAVSISPPPTAAVGQPANFQLTVTSPAGGSPIQNVTVDFGDGTRRSYGAVTGTQSVQHTYQSSGTYLVTATATDAAGQSGTVSTSVSVTRQSILVNLSVTPNPATVNQLVTVSANVTGSTTPPGAGSPPPAATQPQRFEYDFGDGTVRSINSPSTTHIYSQAGTRLVRVSVFMTDGQTATAETQVLVRAP